VVLNDDSFFLYFLRQQKPLLTTFEYLSENFEPVTSQLIAFKMKKHLSTILLLITIAIVSPIKLNSQEDVLFSSCIGQLKSPFVASGQPFRAFLTGNEVAEFHTTFFSGSMYRVVACSHQDSNILFSIYDKERNLLFSNEQHEAAGAWDFKMEGSVECIVEARLNPKKSTSGMAMLMIGFKSLEKFN